MSSTHYALSASISISQLLLPALLLLSMAAWPTADGLRCHQGSQNLSAPLTSSPTDCPMIYAFTCTKVVDFRLNQITRACSSTNCTINVGNALQLSVVPVCVNTTANNVQSTYCCCYGDACNSALAKRGGGGLWQLSLGPLLLFVLGAILSAGCW